MQNPLPEAVVALLLLSRSNSGVSIYERMKGDDGTTHICVRSEGE